eukprot:COSAG02_NODE_2022_length_10084_cov_2.725643_2_plen_702_part_00
MGGAGQAEPSYWAAASGLFGDGEVQPELQPELQPEPEPEPELKGGAAGEGNTRGHGGDAPTDWQSRSAQLHYSEEQKNVLLEQAAHAASPIVDTTAAHETALAIEAAGGIRQAWKGLLSKPQFRSLMAEARSRPAPEPSEPAVDLDADSLEPSAVGAATAAGTRSRHTGGLRDELSSLAACTGVAAPPPGWSGWQHERQQLSLSSPTFMVLSYIFPEDTVQVLYVSGEEERVAWSVPWKSVRAKRTMTGAVSLLRKPDGAYMAGVDKLQWIALQKVRERAKASEREYLAAQLHCDASMMMYPQRSLLLDSSSTETAVGPYCRPLRLPVGMKRSSRASIASFVGQVSSMVSTAAQSLQSMQEGSLPSWYFSAMHTSSAGQSETAIASLKQMAEAYDKSRSVGSAVPSEQFSSQETCAYIKSEKPLLLPVTSEWVPRSPRIAATPPSSGTPRNGLPRCQVPSQGRGRVGGGFQRPSSQQAATRLKLHRAQIQHSHLVRTSCAPAAADLEKAVATAEAVGSSEGAARRRAMATISTTRPATTMRSPRAQLARSAASSRSARPPITSSALKGSIVSSSSHVQQANLASPRRTSRRLCASPASKGISDSVHVSSPVAAARARQNQLLARRRAAEAQLASLEMASNQNRPPSMRPAETVATGGSRPTVSGSRQRGTSCGGQESKSRPVSRVDSPATAGGFLYSAFNR